MRVTEFYPPSTQCSYLEGESASFRYFFIQDCEEYFYKGLLERGYRRFGEYFFVPICHSCSACKTIRQIVSEFKPNSSHRRVLHKNAQTKIIFSRPSVSDEKLELYDRYHFKMRELKGWKYHKSDAEYYFDTFVAGAMNFGYEICYYIQEKLVGVAYVDILKDCMSSIYFFYDHNFKNLSLGVLNILAQIEIAKGLGIAYFYPGYWIDGHHSLGYKSRFQPFEILNGVPNLFDSVDYQLEKRI